MSQIVPEIVRIGVGNARIKCVTTQQVEYLDEAGQECLVDLEDSNRNYNQLHNEDEGDFVLLTSEEGTGDLSSRYVGGRELLHYPPWIEFTNKRRTRFEFGSSREARTLKLQLLKVRWRTLDMS